VYEDHVWDVYGFVAYRVRRREDAEDLTQQTFERAARAWGRFDPGRASARTWLIAIARNLVIDHFRADRPNRSWEDGGAAEFEASAASSHPGASDGLSPDLDRALHLLSDRDREVIALRFGAELKGPEIAELLGLTLANVQQILSRSLRKMRAELEPGQVSAG
jgi:RNA polymerase sigma-70 factor (ECF subfamily)